MFVFLSRRREHLHARALQIRAELSTHIHRETAHPRPTHSFWSLLFEKTRLECGKKLSAFRQRQAHTAVHHAARSRPARSATGHRARTRASSRERRIFETVDCYMIEFDFYRSPPCFFPFVPLDTSCVLVYIFLSRAPSR